MNQQRRRFEIEMMWRQLNELRARDGHDYLRNMNVRLFHTTHIFSTYREVHAFLSGALDAIRYTQQEQEDADQSG